MLRVLNLKKDLLIFSFFLVFLLNLHVVASILNPASTYCKYLGYSIKYEGSKVMCILPNNQTVDAWNFWMGKIGKEYGFCARLGLDEKVVENSTICGIEKCVVCVYPNKTLVPRERLMKNYTLRPGYCGDGTCQIFYENHLFCPQDCPSGSYDGYCDGIADGICDQDCIDRGILEKDPDCKPVCGNKICEVEKNESWRDCCIDCPCPASKICANNTCIDKKTFCGNSVCESFENYKTCKQDCSSGSKDGYCDGIADGICDPDCKELKEFDPDCVPSNNLWIYFLLAGIAVFIGLIYYETKKKSKRI